MTTPPFLHASFLVPDIEEAAETYGRYFGVTFRDPLSFPLEVLQQTGISDDAGTVRYCYSVEGDPYFELIEAVGSHIYSPDQGYGFHHIAMWMDDEEAKRDDLERLGVKVIAATPAGDGHSLSIFTEAHGPLGVRIEFMNRRYQQMFERFFATGRMD